jgi:hypothetical protein
MVSHSARSWLELIMLGAQAPETYRGEGLLRTVTIWLKALGDTL